VALDADDAHEQLVAFTHQLRRIGGGRVGHLAGVQEGLNARLQADERAKLGHAGDLALDQLADMVHLVDQRPGVGLQALEAQADALAFGVQAQHEHLNLVAHAQQLARVAHTVPGQLGDVDQAVSPAEIDKRAEIAQTADDAPPHFAFLKLFQEGLFALGAAATLGLALAENQTAALAVDLDNLDGDLATDQVGHVVFALAFIQAARQIHNMTGGHKATQVAKRDDQTAPVGFGNNAFEERLIGQGFFRLGPVLDLAGLGHGNHQIAFVVFRANHHNRDFVAHGTMEVIAQPLQVAAGHHRVTLEADIDDQALVVHRQDGAGQDISTFRLLDIE